MRKNKRKHFKKRRHAPLLWLEDYNINQFIYQQSTFSFSSQHFMAIFLSLLPFTGNLPFIRRPNTCIVVWQQLICCWSCQPALQCYLLDARGSQTIPKGRSLHNKLCIMCSSVMTMAAISLDRLLALLLGLKYRQIVALKPTYIQVLSDAAVLSFILNYIWYTHVTRPSYLLISITSYTKIFGALSHHIYCLNCLLDCSCCCCSMYHF